MKGGNKDEVMGRLMTNACYLRASSSYLFLSCEVQNENFSNKKRDHIEK